MKKNFTFIALTLLLGLFSWSATAQVNVAGSASGNGTYTTLGDAIAAIPLSGQSGNNITVELSASTSESSAITIGAGTWATLKIYPTSSSVICSVVAITLSGATNVTIDGRVNQTGTPVVGDVNSLTLSSTSITDPVLLFNNDAQTNTVKYCTIKIGALPNTTGGIAFGATAAVTNGNGLNVIDNNLITSSGATYPFYAIYADGNTSNPNKGNQITNNEFTNFMFSGGSAIGINILGNLTSNINDNYTISGNSMYGGVTTNTGGNRFFMQIGALGNGGSHTITGNYIGGSSANCGGSKMTKSGSVVSHFSGISLATSATGTSLVQNNRIKNISWTTSAGIQNFTGISVSGSGNATISGNSIGDNSTSGYSTTASIIHSIIGTSPNTSFIGIGISTTGTATCDNNQIGSIKTGNTGVAGTGAVAFTGIFKSGAGTTTISNNIIGSLTAPYSINDSISNPTLYNQNILGINLTGTGISTAENNTIANISNMATGGTSYGIQMNGTGTGTNTANANLIHSMSVTGATTHILLGISSSNGTNLITNNIIKLGDNNPAEIRAIADGTNSVSTSGYHNTVYLSGNPSSGTLKSACIFSSTGTKIRNYKNNILVNTRFNSGAASGVHSVVNMSSKSGSGTISLDGNDYYFSGASAVLGNYGTTLTLPFLTGEASVSVDPLFANAGGTLAADYLPTGMLGVSGTSVGFDYAGTARANGTIGAFEIAPVLTISSSTLSGLYYRSGSGPEVTLHSFDLSGGTSLSGDITVTAPANFEVSKTGLTGEFTPSVTVAPTSGSVATTPIYVRLVAGLGVNTYTGDVTVSASGAVSKTVALSGIVDISTSLKSIDEGVRIFASLGEIKVIGATAGDPIEVYNSLGQKVKTLTANQNDMSISLSAKGVYVIKAGSSVNKVILQ